MEKELYNTILLVGPDIILDLETIKLFEKNQANGWVIIGETQDSIDHNISLPIVERKLENKIAPNAKIFISAHGLQTGLENKEHTVQLQGKDSINTKEYFTQLSELNSNKPLHINLLSCHGAAANKNISALAAGSTLITYVDSKYPSWTKLLNYAEEKILERLSNDPSITPAQQFIRSLTENFQGMAFSSKDQNGNTKTFKTTRFLKDENIKDLLFLLKKKEGRTARELILDELEYNKEMFCKEFPEYKKEVQNIEFNLDDNQIKDLITGKILHLFLKNFKEQNKDVNNFEQKINKIQQEIAKETDSKKKNKFKARKFELERDFYISLKETQTNLKELIQILKKDNNFDLYHSINGLNIAQMRYNDQAKLNPIYFELFPEAGLDVQRSLLKAIKSGDRYTFRKLFEDFKDKLDMNFSDNNETLLHSAIKLGFDDMYQLLNYEHIDPNIKDNSGNTPLHLLAEIDSFHNFESFIRLQNINVNAQNTLGQTPLHILAISDSNNDVEEMVNLLLRNKYIDPNIKDNSGKTPLAIAKELGKDEIVQLIQDYLNSHKPPVPSKQSVLEKIALAKKQLVKEKLLAYFEDELSDKEIVTSAQQSIMKKKIIGILSPLAMTEEEKNDLKKVAGKIVREATQITGQKLDWKQKLFLIKDKVKDMMNKLFLNKEENKFANILKENPKILENLRKSKETKRDRILDNKNTISNSGRGI